MAKLQWTPWHEVVKLREDLRSGELPLHMFAADLYEVLMQSGKRPIYEDPGKFFALTFPAYNLRRLVQLQGFDKPRYLATTSDLLKKAHESS